MISDALDRITALLPASWRLVQQTSKPAMQSANSVVKLAGPDATKTSFAIAAKRSGSLARPLLIAALRDLEQASGMPVLFVSDYIGPALREALTAAGFSFADTTGWVRLASTNPLILLTGQGSARSPAARKTSAVTRLNGLAANRIIRSLTTAEVPVGVRELAGIAGVSSGSVSKLLVTLAAEGIVDRDESGGIAIVRRRALMRRWTVDYSFAKTNDSVSYFIAPRGLQRTLDRLEGRQDAVLTGSAAARRFLPDSSTSVVPLKQLAIYSACPAESAAELELINADLGTANVVVARPQDPDIYQDRGTAEPIRQAVQYQRRNSN